MSYHMSLSGDIHPAVWLDKAFYGPHFCNDGEFYLATSLYRSVEMSRLRLIRALGKRGVMCPFWDAIDTPGLIRGFIACLYDEMKKDL